MNRDFTTPDDKTPDKKITSETPTKTKLERRRKIEDIQEQRRLKMELNEYD